MHLVPLLSSMLIWMTLQGLMTWSITLGAAGIGRDCRDWGQVLQYSVHFPLTARLTIDVVDKDIPA